MNMKIVHLSCVAPPEIGGIGRAAMKEVTMLRARGIHADLVAPEPSSHAKRAELREHSFVKRLKPFFRFGNASMFRGLRAQLSRYDLIHLHYPFFGVAETLLIASKNLPPIVVTYHMDALAPGLKGAVFALHRTLIQPLLLPRAKAVIVSSYDYAKRSSIRRFFSKNPSRVRELPFGVDTERFRPGPSSRERFLIPERAITYLFVGGLDRAHAFKGTHLLLEAFSRLPQEAHLLIVGDGDLRGEYEDRARSLGVISRVHFLGRLDEESLIQAYNTADIFVFPSTSRAEAFGLAALEAEACGKPVIASDLPGVRTVVRQGETGLLVQPGDSADLQRAMSRLFSEREFRLKLGEGARRHAEHFSWDVHTDELMRIYEHCRHHE